MRISAKAEYACLAVVVLAQKFRENRPIPIREIAEAQGIPETFLNQILLKLKGAGVVLSARGASGGYRLARAPEDVSLGDVLRAVDGYELTPREHQGRSGPVLAEVWEQLRTSETGILGGTSIAQLAERTTTADWII